MYCVTAHVKIRGKSSKEKNEVYKKNKTLKKPKFPIQRREELMKLNILRDQCRRRGRRDVRAMGVVTRGVSLSAITASSTKKKPNQSFRIEKRSRERQLLGHWVCGYAQKPPDGQTTIIAHT